MIISHKYKFIFLKTNKTAGSSIEIALSEHCATNDIITPLGPEEIKIKEDLGCRGAQNYYSPIWEYGFQDLLKYMSQGKKKVRFYNHITAREVRAHLGEQVWDSYFKFCFERNPWDRIISHYYWNYRSEPRPSISDYIKSRRPLILKQRGYDLYTIDGNIAVDKVCRFENMSEELEVIRRQLGIPEKLELPRTKSVTRKDKRSYREILSVEDRDYISELFRDEINIFRYEY